MQAHRFWIAVLLLAALAVALAAKTPRGEIVPRKGDDEVDDREFELEIESLGVKVEGSAANGRDSIEFEMELGDEDDRIFESEFKWKSYANDTETLTALKFHMFGVVEYREDGTTPGFQPDEDEIVSTLGGEENFVVDEDSSVPNTPVSWDALEPLVDEYDAYGVLVKGFQAVSMGGVLTIRGKISTQPTSNFGVALNPNSMKIDIEVTGYPGKMNDTFLALVCRLKAKTEMDDDADEGRKDDEHDKEDDNNDADEAEEDEEDVDADEDVEHADDGDGTEEHDKKKAARTRKIKRRDEDEEEEEEEEEDDEDDEGEEGDKKGKEDKSVKFKRASDALPIAVFFGWDPTLTVDGVTVGVIASEFLNEGSDDEGTDYRIIFSFPAAGTLYSWDPRTGVTYSSAGDSAAASTIAPFYFSLF